MRDEKPQTLYAAGVELRDAWLDFVLAVSYSINLDALLRQIAAVLRKITPPKG